MSQWGQTCCDSSAQWRIDATPWVVYYYRKASGTNERPSNAGRCVRPVAIEFFLDQVRITKETAERLIRVDLPKKICSLNEYLEVRDDAVSSVERPE